MSANAPNCVRTRSFCADARGGAQNQQWLQRSPSRTRNDAAAEAGAACSWVGALHLVSGFGCAPGGLHDRRADPWRGAGTVKEL